MARKNDKQPRKSSSDRFQFIVIEWSKAQLEALRQLIGNTSYEPMRYVSELVDNEWKVSVSKHKKYNYYIGSLTDKGARPGCDGRVYAVEHSDLFSCIMGAWYYAMEVIPDGDSSDGLEEREFNW